MEHFDSTRGKLLDLDHACPWCHTLVPGGAASCLECQSARPDSGWQSLEDLPPDPFLGRVFKERYLITKQIGSGASGRVYRAESLVIPRQFAIKFISIPGTPDSPRAQEVRERIRRETNAVLSLRNPHVIDIYDFFEVGARHVAIVMELVRGQTLEMAAFKEGHLDVHRALKITRQVANGLFEAHEHGLIHRDIKPENIMLERLPAGDDFAHLLDFGIVWARGEAHVTDGFIGTPLFASPDQIMNQDPDPRSDIYSLGATLFFALSGQPPFPGDSPMAVLQAHVRNAPPSIVELRGQNSRGLGPMSALVYDMMAKAPEDRPGSLRTVIARLDEIEAEVFHSGSFPAIAVSPEPRVSKLGGCSSCAVLKMPENVPGRKQSDVPCMAEFELVDRFAGARYARIAQTRFALLDARNRATWGSLLVEEIFQCSKTIPAEVRGLALTDRAIWVATSDGRLLRIEEPDTLGENEFADASGLSAIAVDPREWVCATVDDDGKVWVRRNYLDEEWRLLHDAEGETTAIAISPMGTRIVTGNRSGALQFFDVKTLEREEHRQLSSTAPVKRLAMSTDDYLVAALTGDGEVHLDAPLAGQEVLSLRDFSNQVEDLAFSKQNQLMAVCTNEERLFVIDLQCRYATTCTPEDRHCHHEH